MRYALIATLLVLGAAAAPAFADPAAAPAAVTAAKPYTTATTNIGDLLADPASKAIVDAHIPGFSANPQIQMASGMTLRAVQQMAPDKVTNEMLDGIDADLAKLK